MGSWFRLTRFVGLVCLLACAPLVAALDKPPAQVTAWTPADEVVRLRVIQSGLLRQPDVAYRYLATTFERQRTPNVQALYAERLILGEAAGAPAGRRDEGQRLLERAALEGSAAACRILAAQLLAQKKSETRPLGLELLTLAEDAGEPETLVVRGDLAFHGWGGERDHAAATAYYRLAAFRGFPGRLHDLGLAYEEGKIAGAPDVPKACRLYYEGARRGDRPARERLQLLADKANADALKLHHLLLLQQIMDGAEFREKEFKATLAVLEPLAEADPEVMTLLAEVFSLSSERWRDNARALALLDRAIALGSDDARAVHAALLAYGRGLKRDSRAGFDALTVLADNGNAKALALLSYLNFWGKRAGSTLERDDELALRNATEAAAAGSLIGAGYAAYFHERGIGAPRDYVKAAAYYARLLTDDPKTHEAFNAALAFADPKPAARPTRTPRS